MNRREFVTFGAAAGLAVAGCSTKAACCSGNGMPRLAVPEKPAKLNLCLQWGAIPVKDDINAKLDYLAANGYAAVEFPSGKWVLENGMKLAEGAKARNITVTTACGPSDFSSADSKKRDAEVEKFLPVLEVLGAMKAVGLIICPARGRPELGHKELRHDFVTNTGKRLAEKAAACGTSIVLEPLQRGETPFLRQVSDAAKMAQEIGAGCTVLGDFWHMSKEESNMMAAFLSAGSLLSHVHIASLKRRKIPGSDGEADNYVDGFKGLKLIGYQGAVSLEAGWVEKGRDAKNKPIRPNQKERHEILTGMCKLLREQWTMA